MNNKIDTKDATKHVPLMTELNDENIEQTLGGKAIEIGGYLTITCECGCSMCTSWIYGCTN